MLGVRHWAGYNNVFIFSIDGNAMMWRKNGLLWLWVLAVVLWPMRLQAADLLPADKAFVPTIFVNENNVEWHMQIADGYYLYQAKLSAETDPAGVLQEWVFEPTGVEKEDEFFGRQTVFYRQAQAVAGVNEGARQQYRLRLRYQGCSEWVGVCYPPVEKTIEINGVGVYQQDVPPQPVLVPTAPAVTPVAPVDSSPFSLGEGSKSAKLLAFFVAGLGLSLTACMYPLLPIVAGIVAGSRSVSRSRALVLAVWYVQGLAFSYAAVGVVAGLTGSLLTVWLQQAWVVLTGAALLVVMALAMFDVIVLQLPAAVQGFFQSQSHRLSGGRVVSVWLMGALSALIVGPCVAPPLAAALAYIGRTGDAGFGAAALYVMALGMGVPLVLVSVFGGHVLPRAGAWMNTVKHAFGVLMLLAAVYLASGFVPYAVSVVLYCLILVVAGGGLLVRSRRGSAGLRAGLRFAGGVLVVSGVFFAVQSTRLQPTFLHHVLSLFPPRTADVIPHRVFTDPAALQVAMNEALQDGQPVLLDFYADWCVSCRQMEAQTFNRPQVQAVVPLDRLFQIDMTDTDAAHQAMLKEYGLFGPPGLFVLYPDGRRSDALIGFADAQTFIEWYRARATPAGQ